MEEHRRTSFTNPLTKNYQVNRYKSAHVVYSRSRIGSDYYNQMAEVYRNLNKHSKTKKTLSNHEQEHRANSPDLVNIKRTRKSLLHQLLVNNSNPNTKQIEKENSKNSSGYNIITNPKLVLKDMKSDFMKSESNKRPEKTFKSEQSESKFNVPIPLVLKDEGKKILSTQNNNFNNSNSNANNAVVLNKLESLKSERAEKRKKKKQCGCFFLF